MRRAMGVAVFSGMLGVTFFGLLLTPVFYLLVRRIAQRRREPYAGAADTSRRNLMSKLALITGANKGIGLETARQLGRQGFHVLIGARDAKAGESAAAKLRAEGITADALIIDVTVPASIAGGRRRGVTQTPGTRCAHQQCRSAAR